MLDEILQLYDYNRWANRRVLDVVGALTPEQLTRDLGSSFPSVRDTLAHVLAAEWVWLERWRGSSPTSFPDDSGLDSHAAIVTRWDEHESDQAAFLEDLTEDRLREVVAYRNTAGQPFAEPLWQLMRHVVNHSTYHRGQVTTMLRQMGAAAVGTDLITYFRERQGSGR